MSIKATTAKQPLVQQFHLNAEVHGLHDHFDASQFCALKQGAGLCLMFTVGKTCLCSSEWRRRERNATPMREEVLKNTLSEIACANFDSSHNNPYHL